MEYYSAMQKKEILPFGKMWLDLEVIIRHEIREKDKYCVVSLKWGIKGKKKDEESCKKKKKPKNEKYQSKHHPNVES